MRKQLSMKRLTIMSIKFIEAKLAGDEKNIPKAKVAQKMLLEFMKFVWDNKDKEL